LRLEDRELAFLNSISGGRRDTQVSLLLAIWQLGGTALDKCKRMRKSLIEPKLAVSYNKKASPRPMEKGSRE